MTTSTTSAPSLATRLFGTVTALRAWTVGSLVVNMVIIVTGAVVRLTSSGLGCPTWPQCSGSSYTPRPELGVHGVIEFSNRMLTFVLIILAAGTLVSAVRVHKTAQTASTHRIRTLAVLTAVGIPLQGVIGGITVLTQLNAWVVSLHMLCSVLIIALCVVMVDEAYGVQAVAVPRLARRLIVWVRLMTAVVIVLGTVVTGAGPHSGDGGAQRNGLDPDFATRLHAGSVWVLLILTVAAFVVTRSRLVAMLLAVQVLQGVIGYVQYFTGLPVLGVVLHMLGLALLTAATAHVYWRLRDVLDPASEV